MVTMMMVRFLILHYFILLIQYVFKKSWKKDMDEEQTWQLVNLPKGKDVLGI